MTTCIEFCTSALSRIYPDLLAKIEPPPGTRFSGEAGREGCKAACSLLRGICRAKSRGENVLYGPDECERYANHRSD